MYFVYSPTGKYFCVVLRYFVAFICDLRLFDYVIFIFPRSVELKVNGLDNRNYTLPIKGLLEEIDADKSHWKVKTGQLHVIEFMFIVILLTYVCMYVLTYSMVLHFL
jgi:hypothetical protein